MLCTDGVSHVDLPECPPGWRPHVASFSAVSTRELREAWLVLILLILIMAGTDR